MMKKLYYYLLTVTLFSLALNTNAQNTYFFNQRNLITVNASINPRLMALKSNKSTGMYSQDGLGLGTFYQYYNDENVLMGGHMKYNLMLNTSYGRIFGGNKIFGVEFNYQKQHMTINESSNAGYQDYNYGYDQKVIPFLVSTPVFNIYDIQLTYGLFNSSYIAPNKHIISYGLGLRIYSLSENENYRKDALTPFTDLSHYMNDYDKSFIFVRLSINYTYRILITKNLSFDLGINTNLTLTADFDPQEGFPSQPGYALGEGAAYRREFVKSRLAYQTFFNIFYFRTGLSFAI
ncbi:MAG TPA: hypothetical protein VKY37_01180 [Brumimicrobium sp.]|nr:hypothetical protein [Brumimicrobium sp.]